MIIAYVSKADKECYSELKNEFTDVKNFSHIDEFISFYAVSKNRDVVFIYRIESKKELLKIQDIYFSNNIYIIVVGPQSTELSLLAGKIGVDAYKNEKRTTPEYIKKLIEESQTIVKRRRGKSNISVFTGISGGVGTTTISMNLAKTLADTYLEKNVLFLDFAHTKAISNLFFDVINPKKTIIDILSVQELDIEEFFKNGLTKVYDNLYIIPGIQRHTDLEALEKQENIQRFLNFINFIKNRFDYIIIDVGLFEDVELEIDVQEIADHIFVITEFNIPAMSILKTYIDIIDKSGWYSKTKIIANRSDSFGTVTHQEAKKILSQGLTHEFEITTALPNDTKHLRECWNEAKLVSDVYPSCPFMQELNKFLSKHFPKDENKIEQNEMKKKTPINNSLIARLKRWL